jgi:hypothetical protein
MSWIKLQTGALLLSLALVSAPVYADHVPGHEGKDQTTTPGHNEAAADEPAEIRGKVLKLRDISQRDSDESCRLAFVETADQQRIAVDLGPVSGLKEVSLKVGDQISAFGFIETADGKPIFVADQARIGGKRLDINHPESAQKDDAKQSEEPRQYRFTGKIIDHDQVGVKDSDVKHLVAVLETLTGGKLLADLGPVTQINPSSIDKGAQVTVEGVGVKVDNRPVLVVEKLTMGDKKLTIIQDEDPQLKMNSEPAKDLKRQESQGPQALPKTDK